MLGNSNILGVKKTPSLTSSSGIFDTFDQFNARRDNRWPITVSYNSLSTNGGSILENTALNLVLTTSGLEATTTLYWTIEHITTTNSSFYNSGVSGGFTQSSLTNTGSFNIITAFTGNPSLGVRQFRIQIRTGSTTGPVVYTSNIFSLQPIGMTIGWSSSSGSGIVSESSDGVPRTAYLNMTISNMGFYLSTFMFNITYSGTATSSDFTSSASTTYYFNTANLGTSIAIVSLTLTDDMLTEGTETYSATLYYNGQQVTSAITLQIFDTSQTPSATATPASYTINEGQSLNFSVSTVNYTTGTLYWTLEATTGKIGTNDVVASSGSFSISSSAGSFSVTFNADTYTEGTEVFTVKVRLNSISGTVLSTVSGITVSDTSSGTTEPVSAAPNPTNTLLNQSQTIQTLYWNRPSANTTYEDLTDYTFPANTPLGWYYLVVWSDYSSSNENPSASTAYRTRRVFSLQVVDTYNFANRVSTAANLPAISGNGTWERIQAVRITNVTRNQLMADVVAGSTADVQYVNSATHNSSTVMVVPGDTIRVSVLLQGSYAEFLNWNHNAR